ncbi:hypothetical protein ACIA8O_34445 [Kitasatospora sp. NPDC051853]|uniref:hypothetical protein n=1 Tax=Kitasatospora sp. NPDC051853 TaxID=3364058 RepID=UPI00379BC857
MVKKSMVGALVVLLVLSLAACGSSGKKKKKKSKTHSTQAASSLSLSPMVLTNGGALTVTYNGCAAGDQLEFGWSKGGQRGSLGTAACSGGSAVLRLPKYTATATGDLQVTGKVVSSGRTESSTLTVK